VSCLAFLHKHLIRLPPQECDGLRSVAGVVLSGVVLSGVYSVARVLCEELAVEGAILNRLKNMVILDFSVPARSARVRAILRIQSNKGPEMRWRYLSIWPGEQRHSLFGSE